MNSPPAPARRSGRFFGTTVMVLLVLYLLSPGPVLRMGINLRAAEIVYAPLSALGTMVPGVQRFYEWYICKLWRVPEPYIQVSN